MVRVGKGDKGRGTFLLDCLAEPLQLHLRKIRALHQTDLEKGLGSASLAVALARKYPNADRESDWLLLGFTLSQIAIIEFYA
jgi:hypothetical protein